MMRQTLVHAVATLVSFAAARAARASEIATLDASSSKPVVVHGTVRDATPPAFGKPATNPGAPDFVVHGARAGLRIRIASPVATPLAAYALVTVTAAGRAQPILLPVDWNNGIDPATLSRLGASLEDDLKIYVRADQHAASNAKLVAAGNGAAFGAAVVRAGAKPTAAELLSARLMDPPASATAADRVLCRWYACAQSNELFDGDAPAHVRELFATLPASFFVFVKDEPDGANWARADHVAGLPPLVAQPRAGEALLVLDATGVAARSDGSTLQMPQSLHGAGLPGDFAARAAALFATAPIAQHSVAMPSLVLDPELDTAELVDAMSADEPNRKAFEPTRTKHTACWAREWSKRDPSGAAKDYNIATYRDGQLIKIEGMWQKVYGEVRATCKSDAYRAALTKVAKGGAAAWTTAHDALVAPNNARLRKLFPAGDLPPAAPLATKAKKPASGDAPY